MGPGAGGDYHDVAKGHWLIGEISTPMSKYAEYRPSRTSWGINVLGSFCVEIEASDGTTGFATGFGGPPACWIVTHHLERFLLGCDPRNTNRLWDQMFRATMFYGRKGLPIATISVVDLALWDLLGKLRGEPVYKMIGGAIKDEVAFYCTGPEPTATKAAGFWGAKVALPYGPDEGQAGLRKNVAFLTKHRADIGPDYPLMVDCWMSLTVQYAIELATACLHLNIEWWEEVLHPDDTEGYALIKKALPQIKFTTGEVRLSLRLLPIMYSPAPHSTNTPSTASARSSPRAPSPSSSPTSCGSAASPSSSKSRPRPPRTTSPSYPTRPAPTRTTLSSRSRTVRSRWVSLIILQQVTNPPQEYLCNAPDGTFGPTNTDPLPPVFGTLFEEEPTPVMGKLLVSQLDRPG
jgi:L-rhamnonate dehydratase